MKLYATIGAAALMLAGPLAGAASAQTYRGDYRSDYRGDWRDDRRDRSWHSNRWDPRRHNGFYLGNRFYYGQPSYQQMMRRDYRPAYQQWRRGDRLPSYHRSYYRAVDWRAERLRQPPRGYHYVRDDRGQILLVGIATGVILSILLSR